MTGAARVRTSQVSDGRGIDHDVGGGEAAHDVARNGRSQGSTAKPLLIGAVPPIGVKTPPIPEIH